MVFSGIFSFQENSSADESYWGLARRAGAFLGGV